MAVRRREIGAHGPQKEGLPLRTVGTLKKHVFRDYDVELVAGPDFQRGLDVQIFLQELERSLTKLRGQGGTHFILECGIVGIGIAVMIMLIRMAEPNMRR